MGAHLERHAEAVVPAQRSRAGRPSVERRPPDRRRARRLTALGLGLWGSAFGAAVWLVGIPTSRGSVVVWALLAVLASRLADLRAGLRSVVVDFLPVFAALAVYDLLRGRADDLTSVAHVDPHLRFDRALALGRTPTERLQDWLWDPASPAWYDYATWAVHLSHFLVSTTLLVVLWRLGSPLFRRLLVGLLVLSYAALATYWAYPAVPPWLAADQGHLDEVSRVVHHVWSDAGVQRAPRLLAAGGSGGGSESPFSDPVAALPSLHAAIPLLLTLTLRGLDRRLTALLATYTLAMGLALVYGGEHYVFDVLLGWAYAYAAWRVTARGLPGRAWRWLEVRVGARPRPSPRVLLRSPPAIAAAAVLLRLPGIGSPARPDEAGYLLVAASARPGGPFLYGDLWVDRPPLLVASFGLADALGGLLAARVLALVAVVALVLAAADAGRTLGGPRGATWAAAVAAALSATPLLGATALNGELLGAPFVMAACALGLRALRPPSGAAWRLAGAGAVGAGALLVKQNLADALVLVTALLVVLAVRRELPLRRVPVLLAALGGGAAVPLLLALVWATGWGAGAGVLWETVFGFRVATTDVLDDHTAAPLRRLGQLTAAAVVAGVAPLLLLLGVAAVRRGVVRTAPALGVVAMAATGAVSIALGGSFWLHYLLQLLPATALAAALLAVAARRVRRGAAVAVALALVSAVASVAWSASRTWTGACGTSVATQQAVRDWLRPRTGPADSAVTLYGVSNALLGSGARPAYPYLWSLPVRTLDPQLHHLLGVLSGPSRATWVVRTLPLHSWGLDRERRVARQLRAAYRPVAEVCGTEILLRDGAVRPPSPP